MPRSFDSRRDFPADIRPSLRGPKRTGPIGTIVPGDHVEVARDIQRLWEFLRRRNKDCCPTTPGLKAWSDGGDGYTGAVQKIGNIAAWWRLGEADPGAWPTTADYFKDSSGSPEPIHLAGSADIGLAYSFGNGGHVPEADVAGPAALGDADDGAIRFTYEQGGTHPSETYSGGVYLSYTGLGFSATRSNQLRFSDELRSISFWFRPEENALCLTTGAWGDALVTPIVTANWSDGFHIHQGFSLELLPKTRILRFFTSLSTTGETNSLDCPVSPPWDEWQHVVITLDTAAALWRMYLNAVLVATAPATVIPDAVVSNVGGSSFAAGVNDVPAVFLGALDEGILFTKTLTATEIKTLYEASGVVGDLPGWVDATITSDDVPDLSVTTDKIVPGIADTALTSDGAAAAWGKVKTAMLDALAVTTAKIADLAVTTAKIADAAVTNGKLAGGIDAAKLAADPNDGYVPVSRAGTVGWEAQAGGGGGGGGHLVALWTGVTPTVTGAGSVWVVPETGAGPATFNLDKALLRIETANGADVTVRIQKSPAGSAFVAADLVTLTVPAGSNEDVDLAALGTVDTGELLRVTWDDIGDTPSVFLVQIEGSI